MLAEDGPIPRQLSRIETAVIDDPSLAIGSAKHARALRGLIPRAKTGSISSVEPRPPLNSASRGRRPL
jgi:hypothetical protein